MASFTDAISQFNPYVSQLPIQAMKEVGMYKQQKYEEGVQKIQGEIDKIAGLDITKPIHKQYLQSKLNEVGSKLKTVAAGDFSNFQLVNSVGGMATQIGKDPTIQNAVRSTQHARKEQENIQIAQKAGKSSVDNENFYYDKYNKWLNDGKLDTVFTDEYIEYKDVDAKLRELTSKLKEDELGIENPYMRDEQGQTLYFYRDPVTKREVASTDPSKGEKKLDLDMLSIKVKGLPAQRILNNFYNSLDSNDIRQMKINSWAHYRGAGPEYFKSDIVAAYENKKEMLSQEKIDLAVKIQNPQITGVAKSKLESRLADVNKMMEDRTLEKEMDEDLLELQNPKNLEDFKYKLYTQQHLTGLAKDLSYRSYIQERKANPAEQADMARKKFQFEQVQESNKLMMWRTTENRLQAKDDYERLKDLAATTAKGYRVTPGDFKTGVEPPKVEDLQNDIKIAGEDYVALQNKFAERIFSKNDSRYKNMTFDEKKKALDNLSSDYRKNPNMVLTPDQENYLEQLRQQENNLTKTINLYSAAQEYENDFRKDYVSKKLKEQKLSVRGVDYTGEDIVDFNSTVNKFNKTRLTLGVSGAPSSSTYFDNDAARSYYKNYKGGKLLPVFEAYVKDQTPFLIMSSDDEKLVNFSKRVVKSTGDVDNLAKTAVSKFISTNSPVYAVQRAAIDISDPKKAKDLDEFLATKSAQFANKGSLDVSDFGEYTPSTSAKIRGEKGSTFVIEKSKDGGANVILMGADGTRQIVPAQPSEVALFFPEVAVTSPFADLKETITTSKTRTTNSANQRFVPGSGATGVNAKLSGYQLPQLKGSGYESKVRIDIEGDEDNTGNTLTDSYTVIMYVPDPKTGMWKGNYISGGYVSESDVMTVISKISPDNINQAIKTFK